MIRRKPQSRRPIEQPTAILHDSPAPKGFHDGVPFISDFNDISTSLADYMVNTPNYHVISVIGEQGVGKSTLLSMLGGNKSLDMYREYIFRPVSREANELSKYQTMKLDLFISAEKFILIDCQPMNSVSLAEDFNRSSMLDECGYTSEMMKMLSFLIHVSHTMLVCIDWFPSLSVSLVFAEKWRAHIDPYSFKMNLKRCVNIVLVHTKARNSDFLPFTIRHRARLLRKMLENVKRFRLSPKDEELYFPIPELHLRKEMKVGNFTLPTPVIVKHHGGYIEEISEDFDVYISKLRKSLFKLTKDDFTLDKVPIDQRKWLSLCHEVWNNDALQLAAERYRQFLTVEKV